MSIIKIKRDNQNCAIKDSDVLTTVQNLPLTLFNNGYAFPSNTTTGANYLRLLRFSFLGNWVRLSANISVFEREQGYTWYDCYFYILTSTTVDASCKWARSKVIKSGGITPVLYKINNNEWELGVVATSSYVIPCVSFNTFNLSNEYFKVQILNNNWTLDEGDYIQKFEFTSI